MGSTFGAYGIAYSGMYVNQVALATTSTNLANVDTTGASRVRAVSTDKNTVLSTDTSVGSGVSIASITRARDQLLDNTYRTQNAKNSYLSVKSGNLEYSDEILSEFTSASTTDTTTTTSGVQQVINDFFNSWQTLSTDSSTATTRQSVITAGTTLISTLTDIDDQLQQLQEDAVNGVKDGVDSLNDLAKQVADLNQQISKAEVGGSEASYLRDQRDTLLDQMSSLAEINTSESNGSLQVTLGGVTLVNGTKTHALIVKGSGTSIDPLTVEFADGTCKVNISSGSIGAYLEDADQTGYETIDSSNIPYNLVTTGTSSISTMRQSLNDLITTLATELNSVHSSGVDLNGDSGLDFFTVIDSSQPLSISNIQVNPLIVADSDKIVTASSNADGDNTIANKIWNLSTDTTSYQCDGLSLDITDFYKAVTSWIGTAGDTTASSYTSQTALVQQVDNQRQAVSSISLDEEMSNMIKFQNAYAASAKVMSTIDSLLAGLIEDLG
ncbi:flagellar hook-associated protein FlgK [Pelosinus sp. sgz500959]|uniref:flagellar hook-associated protein FlgK n=1 Tax=Pelosinus sp. sgz500959 TaxID=3242472 RepID=UPI003670F815